MKTPREVLLGRHQGANAKLDAIRRTALEDLNNQETTAPRRPSSFVSLFLRCSQKCWRELILPKPQAWAGLAAIWVLIFALKFSTHDTSHVLAGGKSSVSPAAIAEVRQQKLLFAELAGISQLPDGKPSKPFPPRPRSAGRYKCFAA